MGKTTKDSETSPLGRNSEGNKDSIEEQLTVFAHMVVDRIKELNENNNLQ